MLGTRICLLYPHTDYNNQRREEQLNHFQKLIEVVDRPGGTICVTLLKVTFQRASMPKPNCLPERGGREIETNFVCQINAMTLVYSL